MEADLGAPVSKSGNSTITSFSFCVFSFYLCKKKFVRIGQLRFSDYPVFLAPLEDITDPPYRAICKRMGADMVYTEFISSDGLIRDAGKSLKKLDINSTERPVGIQIFGNDKEAMVQATIMAAEASPDVIDINWGCPVKKVAMKGAGSGILQNIPAMIAITEAVVRATNIPVTVKTRLGWDENSKPIVEIAERLQDAGIAAITIHGRTRSQLYGGKADWSLIGAVKQNPRMKIPVIGNGDIATPDQAKAAFDRYGVDAVMIGRAAIGNPWLFAQTKALLAGGPPPPAPSLSERIMICKSHLTEEISWKGERQAVHEMRKFYTGYFNGLPDIKVFRTKLVTAPDAESVLQVLAKMVTHYQNGGTCE